VLLAYFGDRVPVARAFAAHLANSGTTRGLIGPREVPRIWSRHMMNCAAVAPLLPSGARVADVGSGAGLPGLVLAIARPDVRLVLVEPLLRRVSWLDEVVSDLALPNVEVHRARAEELAGLGVDVTTARAVAALDRLAAWCLPLLRPAGVMLALKGRSAAAELAESESSLRSLGAASWRVHEVGGDVLEEPTTVIEVHKSAATTAPGKPQSGRGRSRRASRSTP
jgi:16S rRNA (guanine527-N7)-methyltransferase